MKNLYVIQHVSYEHPGMIIPWAESRRVRTHAVPLYEGAALPALGDQDILLVMGGPMGAEDDDAYPWLGPEKQLIRATVARNLPVMGICLGAQLLASVLGATVVRSPHTEIGFHPVTLTQAALDTPFFDGIPKVFRPFHWHRDTFFIPEGGDRFAGNDACMNQGFMGPGRTLGLQFHLEAGLDLIDDWRPRLPREAAAPFIQGAEEIAEAAVASEPENTKILETILDRFFLARP